MALTHDAPPGDVFRRTDELRALIAPRNVRADVLASQPIPTNEWWGNLLAWSGENESDAIFSSPYTYRVVQRRGFSASYLAQYRVDGPVNDNGAVRFYFYPPTIKNLLFSAREFTDAAAAAAFTIDAWDDLGVVLSMTLTPTQYLRTYVSVGNAFTTVEYANLHVELGSDHGWLSINGAPLVNGQQYTATSFEVTLNNNQKWLLFFFPSSASGGAVASTATLSTTVRFENNALTTIDTFNGVVQAAFVSTNSVGAAADTRIVELYERCAGVFAKGARVLTDDASAQSFGIDWQLMSAVSPPSTTAATTSAYLHFALDHLLQMLDVSSATPHAELTLQAHTRGPMQACTTPVSAPRWVLRVLPHVHTDVEKHLAFYPPADRALSPERIDALSLCQIVQDEIYGDWDAALPHEGSYYFKGKALQKFGTMCLLAKQLATTTHPQLLPVAQHGIARLQGVMAKFVSNASAYPLVYDTVYGGIITSEAIAKCDVNVDFGNAVYNDHHYHYGYVITAAAMLLHLSADDAAWCSSHAAVQLRVFVDTLVRDVVSVAAAVDGDGARPHHFPRFRHFNWFLGHSYSHGVTPMADGKDEESTSEEVNFLYGVALYSAVTENRAVAQLAKLMLKVYALAVNTYFLIARSGRPIHPPAFRANKITGIFFDNKCDYATWFSANKECIHGIQMLPVSPITPAVRSRTFVQEEWDDVLAKLPFVRDWCAHANGWTSLLFANYSAVDSDLACSVLAQCPMDDGLSRAWALYIAATNKQQ